MTDIWFISDTHFNHKNILTFKDDKGDLIRPGFKNSRDMDACIVDRWNSVVKPGDKVYHLGDVAFGLGEEGYLDYLLSRLHGKKRLTVGNHDDLKSHLLQTHFQKISLWKIFKEYNFFCSHVPLPLHEFRKVEYQVHGHLHQNLLPEKEYISVCVEHTDYTPVHLDEIRARIK